MELVHRGKRYFVASGTGYLCTFCDTEAVMLFNYVAMCENHVNRTVDLSAYPTPEECWDLADEILP